jgi:hypothetical protein
MSAQFLSESIARNPLASVIADGENAHLFGRKPEREIAGVMLD